MGSLALLVGLVLFAWLWGFTGAIAWMILVGLVGWSFNKLPELLYDQVRALPRRSRVEIEGARRLARDGRAEAGARLLADAVEKDERDETLREAFADFLWEKMHKGTDALKQYEILAVSESVRIRSRATHRMADILIADKRIANAVEKLKAFAETASGTKEGSQAWTRARRIGKEA